MRSLKKRGMDFVGLREILSDFERIASLLPIGKSSYFSTISNSVVYVTLGFAMQ